MRHHIALALFLAGLVVSGCNLVGAGGPVLEGRTFLSSSVTQNGKDRPLVPGTQVRLTFKDGNVGVSAGCNSIGGTYRLEGDRLRVEAVGMTEMGCDEPRHAQDEWLSTFLASGPSVALADGGVVLASGDTTITLTDREIADPDRRLVGPIWTVTSIRTDDMMMSMPAGAPATLRFTGDGNVELATGCNQGSAVVTEAEDGMRFGQILLTKRACQGPGAEIEAAVLAVLRAESVRWSIDAANLTLDAGNRGLVLSAP